MSSNEQYRSDVQFIEKIDRMLAKRLDYAAYVFAFAACLLAHLLYVILFALSGVRSMTIFNLFSVLFYVVLLFIVHVVKEKLYLVYATLAEIVLHATAATACVGLESNFAMFLLMIIPLAFLMPNKYKYMPFVILFISVPLYGFLNFYYRDNEHVLYDLSTTSYELVFYIINIIVGSGVLIYVAIIFTLMNTYVECKLRIQTEQLKIMASTDPLTKLNNRREIQKKLTEVAEGTEDYIIGIGDIDDFKIVNDTYGHDTGDVVLEAVAMVISDSLPSRASVARWGGEEFLFIIPGSDINEGRKYADNILERIRRKKFSSDGMEFGITMTIGICLGTPGDNVDKIITKADERLYKGKHSGKNHTEFE